MGETVLVTGGSGFVGAALVIKLLRSGWHVRVLVDNSRGRPRRLASVASDIEFVKGDVRDADAVDRATRGVDAVAHLAFVNGTEFFYSKPQLVLEVGVKGALNTLDACLKHAVPRYWLMSSSEVYQTPPRVPTDESAPMSIPDPLNPRYSYGGGKLISELLAVNYGRERFEQVVIVRPHNVYGPDMGREHVIPQLIDRVHAICRSTDSTAIELPIKGDGRQTRSFVYVDDFTEGCTLAFTRGQHLNIYHVGTGDELTIAELARKVAASFGRAATIIPGEAPQGETSRRCPDIAKISALGYRPAVSIDQGLERTQAWYVAHPDER
jgi:nucleoside-diphosphate-sugar epimerase